MPVFQSVLACSEIPNEEEEGKEVGSAMGKGGGEQEERGNRETRCSKLTNGAVELHSTLREKGNLVRGESNLDSEREVRKVKLTFEQAFNFLGSLSLHPSTAQATKSTLTGVHSGPTSFGAVILTSSPSMMRTNAR